MARTFRLVALLVLVTLFVGGFVEAATQRVGDDCNWKQNCQSNIPGIGPAWANGEITCAVPSDRKPETCTNKREQRNEFSGTCKPVGQLMEHEYGCPCGVHGGDCGSIAMVSRIFWPKDWLQGLWKN